LSNEVQSVAASYSSLVGVAVGNKYEIRRVLGAGGMGVVCEAVHLDLGKRVAVKLIDKSMKESELIVTRFRREARAAGQINSEHIVDVFDVGADPRVGLYMVMEYLVGEDLQGRLERDKRVDVKTGVMIAHQIARGLSKAHAAGVIHRDLKPANVYITERDNGQMLVKLLDFGVSKLLGEDPGSARITGHGSPIGTPLYMAPEQAEGKEGVDGRADIWSLGALMYEALAGVPPFADRGSYHGTIVGILTSRPKLLHSVAPWVPPEVARVVDAMLVHDRDARIADATTVAQRLLDAFPSVLPDGTGKYTAVIVPQSAAAVDATGDTEVFNSASMGGVFSRSQGSHPGISSRPGVQSGGAVQSGRISGPPSQDPKRFPDAPTAAGEALRTGVATPIATGQHLLPDRENGPITKPSVGAISVGGGGGRKTEPMPPSSSSPGYGAISSSPGLGPSVLSSGGVPATVTARATPASIDPLPPATTPSPSRDEPAADRPSRRGSGLLTLLVVALAIVGVAIGGYLAGRRASQNGLSPSAPAPRPEASASTGAGSSTEPATTGSSSQSLMAPAPATAASVSSSHAALSPATSGSVHATTSASTTEPLKKKPRPKPAPTKTDDEPRPIPSTVD
jgi:eukaryotic-like serine/threonine-protein kinase